MEKDNQGQIYQEKSVEKSPVNLTPWLIGGGVVLVVGYILPGEYAHSILTTETNKEKPAQELENILKSIQSVEENPADSEKQKLEKKILKLKRKIKEDLGKVPREPGEEQNKEVDNVKLKWFFEHKLVENWVEKWGQKENSPTLLFCGEEFNEQLAAGRGSLKTIEKYNIIDFGSAENNKPETLQKKVAKKSIEQNTKQKSKKIRIWQKHY